MARDCLVYTCKVNVANHHHEEITTEIYVHTLKIWKLKKKEKPHKTASLARKMIIKNLKTVTTHQIISFMENGAVQ